MKKGEKIVHVLRGAGVETASIRTIAKVHLGRVWLDGDDVATFNTEGRELEPSPFAGFSKRLIHLEQ